MAVEENLRLVADDLSVKQCMEELEMTSWSSYYPSSISAGMTQKVKIARLSLLPAEVWLLDEPFNGLDLHSKEVVQMFLKKYQNGRTVILVTHNPKEAVSMSERIIFWDTQKMRPDAEWCSHDDIEQLVTYMLQETTSKERQ